MGRGIRVSVTNQNFAGPITAPNWLSAAWRLLPGLGLCVVVTAVAMGLEQVQVRVLGRAWLESLVLAILVGTVVRTVWTPGPVWRPGVCFSAKMLLEIAVVLLGASVSAKTLLAAGPVLLLGIAGLVVLVICVSYGLGRLLGLHHRMATLVACGNSICGNSAIAAVAPVIGADGDDIAASIAFTALLGVLVVLLLPLVGVGLHMSGLQYGALAGLTVYAVPQVLAAAAPMGMVAVQFGTLVKLMRVLMLGPVCLVLSLLTRGERPAGEGFGLQRFIPWFILGFLSFVLLRALGAFPPAVLPPIAQTATLFTIVSMAALGLGVDVRVVARASGPVVATATLSILLLGVLSLGLIHLAHLA